MSLDGKYESESTAPPLSIACACILDQLIESLRFMALYVVLYGIVGTASLMSKSSKAAATASLAMMITGISHALIASAPSVKAMIWRLAGRGAPLNLQFQTFL